MKRIKTAISMIVPLYKGSRYLRRIVEMYNENSKNFREKFPDLILELILINDYPDEKIDLSNLDLEFDNIYIIQNKENIGIHCSKIEGLHMAQGEFVVFLDQDDLISPYYFVEQYRMIADCDAVICNVDLGEGPHYLKQNEEALNLSCYMKGNNAISSLGQVLLKKEAIPQEWEKYTLSCNGADDYYLIFIMLLKKQRMVEHRKTLYYHVHTGNNFSTDFNAISFSVIEVLEKFKQIGLLTQKIADSAIEQRKMDMEELLKEEEKYPCNIRKEHEDNIKLINLYDKCLKNLEAHYPIDSYIKTFRCNRIAVYGAGKMGKHFIYWMSNANPQIEFIIDKNKKGKMDGIPIINLDEALKKKNKFDIIIVTPMLETKDIIVDLEKLFICPIISLEAVIYNMSCHLLDSAHTVKTARYVIN